MGIQTGSIFPDPPKQQPYRYGRREGGRYAVVPYESLSQNQVQTLAAQADLAGYNYQVDLSFGKARLEIEYPYNDVVSGFSGQTTEAEITWEMVPNKALKSILDSRNPMVINVLGTTNGFAEIQVMKTWVAQNTLYSQPFVDPTTYTFNTAPYYGSNKVAFSAYGILLLQALMQGVEQVEVPAPILTFTQIVTARYIYPASCYNVGLVYSTSTLLSVYNVPTAVLFNYPNNTDPAPVLIPYTSQYQVYLYGWLKNAPSVRQVSKKKWSLTQTFDYGLWLIAMQGGTRL